MSRKLTISFFSDRISLTLDGWQYRQPRKLFIPANKSGWCTHVEMMTLVRFQRAFIFSSSIIPGGRCMSPQENLQIRLASDLSGIRGRQPSSKLTYSLMARQVYTALVPRRYCQNSSIDGTFPLSLIDCSHCDILTNVVNSFMNLSRCSDGTLFDHRINKVDCEPDLEQQGSTYRQCSPCGLLLRLFGSHL